MCHAGFEAATEGSGSRLMLLAAHERATESAKQAAHGVVSPYAASLNIYPRGEGSSIVSLQRFVVQAYRVYALWRLAVCKGGQLQVIVDEPRTRLLAGVAVRA